MLARRRWLSKNDFVRVCSPELARSQTDEDLLKDAVIGEKPPLKKGGIARYWLSPRANHVDD